MSVSTVALCIQALQHLATFATISNEVEKTVSGLIEPTLSNGNVPRFFWTTVSMLTPVATSCSERFSFSSKWSFFLAYCNNNKPLPSAKHQKKVYKSVHVARQGHRHCATNAAHRTYPARRAVEILLVGVGGWSTIFSWGAGTANRGKNTIYIFWMKT